MSVSKNLYSKFASEAMAPDHVDESGLLENESSTDDADLESSSPVSSEFYPKEVHAYTTGKTLTTGVMDMALLVSNAGQLREAFSSMNDGPEYEYLSSAFAAGLLIVCLIIQGSILASDVIISRDNRHSCHRSLVEGMRGPRSTVTPTSARGRSHHDLGGKSEIEH
ncbi:uncharacterized protein LOC131884002 isoform X2 [Tigriopus californicus]|uniref:uncharacterized protein LOC131884002 isoform X2 n=1 Tax=Tigriopus californicus TaxID=6832 RepID=UPI0027DA57DD|nr:uncharacterized protein LOC131884002 isoform X2 [Tigriopus californicus]